MDDLFEDFCEYYWEEAVDRFLADSGNLSNLLYEMIKPTKETDNERIKKLQKKYMLIICGIATEAYMDYHGKVSNLRDEIIELEDTPDFKDEIGEILHEMWEDSQLVDEFLAESPD